jgi:predicted esterase
MKIASVGPALLPLASVLACLSGCVVPQPPGDGQVTRRVEPQTRTGYWLYLPTGYVEHKGQRADHQRWPLVVTFHGMKPWDSANPQIREWEQEADRYGFVVIAPELRTCDSFMQFPLRDPTLPYVEKDERAVLMMMDEVFRTTNTDPARVLATSWSSGGYIAHFMVNRHPERFSCIAVRQSNFSEDLLNESQVPKYRNMRVGIFFGENDLPICREESIAAVEWYRHHHFSVQAKLVSGLGHERTPQTAAAFFATGIGAVPNTPPDVARLVLRDIPSDDVRTLSDRKADRSPGKTPPPEGVLASTTQLPERRPQRDVIFHDNNLPEPALLRETKRVPPKDTPVRTPPTARPAPVNTETPKRPYRMQPYSSSETTAPRSPRRLELAGLVQRERSTAAPLPAKILVHGENVGHAPMWVSLSVDLPQQLRDGAVVTWTDNSQPMKGDEFEAIGLLRDPGDHAIQAHITTADDQRITVEQTVTVLPPASQPAES